MSHAPVSPFYQDPDPGQSLCSQDLEEHIEALVAFRHLLTQPQRDTLWRLLHSQKEAGRKETGEPVEYGADFDLEEEITEQIRAVRAVREACVDPAGRVKDGTSVREVKEVVSAGSTLLTSLMRHHTQVVNLGRIRNLERAVVDVLREEDPGLRDRVLQKFEERLEGLR